VLYKPAKPNDTGPVVYTSALIRTTFFAKIFNESMLPDD